LQGTYNWSFVLIAPFHSFGPIRISAVAIASEIAALRLDVQGPGTFLPAFIDELSKLTPEALSEKVTIEIL